MWVRHARPAASPTVAQVDETSLVITLGDIDAEDPTKKLKRFTPLANYLAKHLSDHGIEEGRVVIARELTIEVLQRQRVERELRHSRTRIVTMAEALRREIAGHLHETLQNKLLLMLYRIDEMLKMGPPGPLALELGQTRDLLEQVIEKEVRQFSTGVYPGILRRGLIAGLQSLAARPRNTVGECLGV